MRNLKFVGGSLFITLLLGGCGETMGQLMLKTGTVPDMKATNDQKKVAKKLNQISRNTIASTNLNPISSEKVFVFTGKIPSYCTDIGWIIARDTDGFDRREKKKVGLFYNNLSLVNDSTKVLKNKAAGLGIEAIDYYSDPYSKKEYLIQFIRKYMAINYVIDNAKITATLVGYKQLSKDEEDKCKKSAKGNEETYYQCLINKSVKKYGYPRDNHKIILVGAKALVCNPLALKKLRKGENTLAIEIELKTKKLLNKTLKEEKKKQIKISNKNEFDFKNLK